MLALGRREGESIIVNVPPSKEPRQIRVTLVRHARFAWSQSRIGIEAPAEMNIVREELVTNEE